MKEFVEQLIAHLKKQSGMCHRPLCDDMAEEMCKFAEGYKPRTNKEKLFLMKDEELANLMNEACPHDRCIHFGEYEMTCDKCILEWLQSETEER